MLSGEDGSLNQDVMMMMMIAVTCLVTYGYAEWRRRIFESRCDDDDDDDCCNLSCDIRLC